MGLFDELGRAFMGKPIGPDSWDERSGESKPEASPTTGTNGRQSSGIVDEQGRKIIPTIGFKQLRSDRIGTDKLVVRAYVANETDQLLRIDTSRLLGQTKTHNQQLNPREARELTLYDGKIPDNENERNAQIAYRLQINGDVFMENYRIDYNLEPDGKRTINDLIDDGPVRDI